MTVQPWVRPDHLWSIDASNVERFPGLGRRTSSKLLTSTSVSNSTYCWSTCQNQQPNVVCTPERHIHRANHCLFCRMSRWTSKHPWITGVILDVLSGSCGNSTGSHSCLKGRQLGRCTFMEYVAWFLGILPMTSKIMLATYPRYHAQVTKLEKDYLLSYQHLLEGRFSVQLSKNNTFCRIPVDQTVEETVNHTQTPGGTRGFSLKPMAVSKYYLTAKNRSTCIQTIACFSWTQIPWD